MSQINVFFSIWGKQTVKYLFLINFRSCVPVHISGKSSIVIRLMSKFRPNLRNAKSIKISTTKVLWPALRGTRYKSSFGLCYGTEQMRLESWNTLLLSSA